MKDPKIHYLAICRSPTDGGYFVANHLYPNEEEARNYHGVCFYRLWREGPSVELDVCKPKETKKVQPLKEEQTDMFV
jgi:hypothetical protein